MQSSSCVAMTSYLNHILPPNTNIAGTLPPGALFSGKFLPHFQDVTFWPPPGNVVGTLPEDALFAGKDQPAVSQHGHNTSLAVCVFERL